MKIHRIALVGCGNIAQRYVDSFKSYPFLKLHGFFDVDPAKVRTFVEKEGGKSYASLDEVLKDKEVDIVLNLTIHHAHVEVITKCLKAGKHVFSEKPLALSSKDADVLVKLSEKKKLRLGVAPVVFMGESQQAVARTIQEGKLGTVRMVYAEVNHGRIESWHPNPAPFYQVGPLLDVGVYPVTICVSIFGKAKRVIGYGKVLQPDRKTKENVAFTPEQNDFQFGFIEFENGTVVRLTTNFYVSTNVDAERIDFHGDLGSLRLSSWFRFNSEVLHAPFGKTYEKMEVIPSSPHSFEWARGLAEMCESIDANRPHRCTAKQGAHVVKILEAIFKSAKTGKAVKIS